MPKYISSLEEEPQLKATLNMLKMNFKALYVNRFVKYIYI
ncbi:hypothetical protein JCM19300_2348 [Algibacter lectus]|uniref:Uncharacterized protein n=1 Tax=Algibacter lectus TaxID=221126 RepID=A0A090VHE2_9FLAO|nr:hypothetical protein JCM19300_2348 [Algibacter lectus]